MYIKSIVLDGFKSYGNRVEVTGFDPEFNAITGLNGTGKSNILDSICFVLGITNLSNVRASSLQELIYKHGQAGITKATVSITFDNRDRKQCPIGYENHDEITVTRQVVMGGKNKYLINGINVQNKRVNDLFCSVQLNVNNPHFLIMQGRITKVLNMKPPEILSMVEEAAGTRMYEAKKQAAEKTIEKKDAKLRELNDIIAEDIAPKLQKLQDERSQFQEYQKVVRELENITRLHVAYKYVRLEEGAAAAARAAAEAAGEAAQRRREAAAAEEEVKELEREAQELSKRLDEEGGSELAALESARAAPERAEAAAAAARGAAREALAQHERRARLLDRAMRDDEAALAVKKRHLDEVSAEFERLQAASAAGEAALAAAQARYLAASAGQAGPAETLQDQLMAAKQQASEASTRAAAADMQRRHCAARLAAAERDAARAAGDVERDAAAVADQERELAELQSQLSATPHDDAAGGAAEARARAAAGAARAARDRADAAAARLQRADFRYSDPEENFDRSRVHGTVCRLIDVADAHYCLALETAAGGRLYNVVVDTERTSKLLLQRGRLQARTTIIPLNKIAGGVVDRRTLALAQEVGGGADSVQLALDLVTFDERLRPAMQWVFGQTLVCRDLDTARKVTFHPEIKRRTVTLEGDVFDPSGTLSGGARVKGGSLLVQIAELKELEAAAAAAGSQHREAVAAAAAAHAAGDRRAALQQRLDTVSHSLAAARARVAASAGGRARAEAAAARAELAQLDADIEAARAAHRAADAAAAELEHKLKDIKGHREREYEQATADLEAARARAASDGAAWRRREQEFAALRLEQEELAAAVRAARAQLDEAVAATVGLQETAADAERAHAAAEEAVKAHMARIKEAKAELSRRSAAVGRLTARREAREAARAAASLAAQELGYRVKELEAEAAADDNKIKALEQEHAWIATDRQYFGQAGGLYDWSRGASAAGARRQQLAARRDKLARGLNARAHTLLGKEEEQYQDVMRKKRIVEADRAKLVQVMQELDDMKRRTLCAACAQVNRDFGAIFSTLLPGAQAQLAPPPGLSVLDGLEVKVGFNSTWKESLGELSGGQRSLVALALVLAMLLFKPAPLYILDEVDAALDLSHTQNIGQMLKEHFKASQFIIVSLKDGMFNNANVLFRTRFTDGMSSVQRTLGRGAPAAAAAAAAPAAAPAAPAAAAPRGRAQR